ncbi:MAG: transcription antitermination factor NusB [Pseudomonadota bacterium]
MSDDVHPEKHSGQSRPADRRKARSLALQALYQRHFSESPISQIEAEFVTDNDMEKLDGAYFRELLQGVDRSRKELDRQFEPLLDRPVSELDPIELAILRIGTFELMNRIDVPYRVVVNEGIELAKRFGGTDGHKYINSILDRLCPRLRPAETRSRRA